MTVHSGKFAVVNGKSTVRNWSINDVQRPARGLASNSRFGPFRKKGIREWSGSFGAFGGNPITMPGETFSFAGYTAPDDDVSGVGVTYSGTAMVESVVITWNWQNGEMLSYVTNFVGHLALAVGSASHSDATTPDLPLVCGTKIELSTAEPVPAYSELTNLAQATLTLNCAVQAYVNSSTVVSGECWTGRKAGPIDWQLGVTQQDNVRSAPVPGIGADCRLKLYTDAVAFWDLWWGHVRDFSGISVDRESGAIIQQTINFDMNAFYAPSTLAIGRIRKPGAGADWWPV